MPRETATERRARADAQARIAQEKWEAIKPRRLLCALARMPQNDPRMHGRVFFKDDSLMYFFYSTESEEISGCMDEMSEYTMEYIESVIGHFETMRRKESERLALRAWLLSRMTDEEKEALGL